MNLPPMNRVSDKFRRTLLQVATHCRVEPSDILSTSRRREHVLPRQLFQWLLVKDHGMDPSAIATRYATKRTGIYHNVKRIDDLLSARDALIVCHLAALRSNKVR